MKWYILLLPLLILISGCVSGIQETAAVGEDEIIYFSTESPVPSEVVPASDTPVVQNQNPTLTQVFPTPSATPTQESVEATPVSEYSEGSIGPGEEGAISFLSSSGEEIWYWIYLPDAYDRRRTWPVIISLHGFLGFETSLEKVKGQFPPTWVAQDVEFPFIVIGPKAPSGSWSKYHEPMQELIKVLGEDISIDPDTQFLTGLSAGTIGVWQWALAFPEQFEGIAPIAGGTSMNPNETILDDICVLKDLPVWIAHSEADRHVPIDASREVVAALEDCGSTVVQFTTYPDLDHSDSISTAYAGPDLYNWMLAILE